MTDGEFLLEAIRAYPNEDTPRLAYADWCEENGQLERAEFIRLQVRRSQLPSGAKPSVACSAREQELLGQNACLWAPASQFPTIHLIWQRGFVEQIELSAIQFIEHAADLFQRFPIHSVTIRGSDGSQRFAARFAAVPQLAQVASLRFRPHPPEGLGGHDEGFRLLLASPYLSGLRQLLLQRNDLTSAAAYDLAQAKHLTALEVLDLSHNRLTGEGVEGLANAAHLVSLRWLGLKSNFIGPSGARALASSPFLRHLSYLDLQRTNIQTAGLRSLLASENIQDLEELHLARLGIGIQGVTALARCSLFHQLRVLELAGNHLGNAGADVLASSPHYSRLIRLGLRQNRISEVGATALVQSPHFSESIHIELGKNAISFQQRAILRERAGTKRITF